MISPLSRLLPDSETAAESSTARSCNDVDTVGYWDDIGNLIESESSNNHYTRYTLRDVVYGFRLFLASSSLIALLWYDCSSLDVVVPLCPHPDQGSGCDDGRTSKTLAPSRGSKDQPLRHEMCECDNVCPESQLVHGLGCDVVGGI